LGREEAKGENERRALGKIYLSRFLQLGKGREKLGGGARGGGSLLEKGLFSSRSLTRGFRGLSAEKGINVGPVPMRTGAEPKSSRERKRIIRRGRFLVE